MPHTGMPLSGSVSVCLDGIGGQPWEGDGLMLGDAAHDDGASLLREALARVDGAVDLAARAQEDRPFADHVPGRCSGPNLGDCR